MAHFAYQWAPLLVDSAMAAVNLPPVAEPDSVTFDQDSVTSITLDVLANDHDPEGQSLQVTAISAPSVSRSVHAEPEWIDHVCADAEPVLHHPGRVTVTDGVSSTVGNAYFEINPIPDRPTAAPDTVTRDRRPDRSRSRCSTTSLIGDTLGLAVGAVDERARATWSTWAISGLSGRRPTGITTGQDTFTYTSKAATPDGDQHGDGDHRTV